MEKVMEDWLQQVRRVAPQRLIQPSIAESRKALRREYRRCSPLMKRLLSELATAYWPETPKRYLKQAAIPIDDGTAHPLVMIWNRIRHNYGWRVVNVQEDECFAVFLAWSSTGFCYELPNDFRTLDTSEEQLQDALCKAAISGPIAFEEHSVYHLM
jgi:hypothetical protein